MAAGDVQVVYDSSIKLLDNVRIWLGSGDAQNRLSDGDVSIYSDGTSIILSGPLSFSGLSFSLTGTDPSIVTVASDAPADDLTISVTGATDSSLILSSTGTGADALQLTASAGGLDISCASGSPLDITDGVGSLSMTSGALTTAALISYAISSIGASSLTVASDGAADDLTISVTGATDSSLILASSGTGADALQITASVGGLDIACATGSPLDIGDGTMNISSTSGVITETGMVSLVYSPSGLITFDAGSTLLLTATTAVIHGDVGAPTWDWAGAGAVSASGNPVFDFGTSQADFRGGLFANNGFDITAGDFTMTGGDINLDPIGSYTLTMDASQAILFEGSNGLDGAFTVTDGTNNFINIDFLTELIEFSNATSNAPLSVLGSGQITLTGNVNSLAGLDVSGGDLTAVGGDFLFTGVNINLDPTGTFDLAMDGSGTVSIHLDTASDSALLIDDGTNAFLQIDLATEQIAVGNAASNPPLNVLGTGQVTISGNVDATAGLDVSGAALTVAAGQVLGTDAIVETSGGAGVIIDGALIKDGNALFNSSLSNTVWDPQVGGELTRFCVDFGIISLNTGSPTTALDFNIPIGANLIGIAANITTAIAGVSASAVTVTLAFTGGSTLSVGTFVSGGDGNVPQDTKLTNLFGYAADTAVTTSLADMALVISGGGDNTPSAGAIRVVAVYETLADLDNA